MSAKIAVAFSPGLSAGDETAKYWLLQASLRLRREICWRWHLRDDSPVHAGALPPLDNPLMVSLDLVRYADAKREFFRTDVTARFLTEQIDMPAPLDAGAARGSFGWVAQQLSLSPADAFALGLAVSATIDGATGPVISACLDDASRTTPTLGLAQRLWDEPFAVAALADPRHVLWRHALLQAPSAASPGEATIEWGTPLVTSPLIARALLVSEVALPDVLMPLDSLASEVEADSLPEQLRPVVTRLGAGDESRLRVVPVQGPRNAAYGRAVAHVSRALGRRVCRVAVSALSTDAVQYLRSLAALAWLSGYDLLLNDTGAAGSDEHQSTHTIVSALRGLPIIVYVPVTDGAGIAALPRDCLQPVLPVSGLDHAERVSVWRVALGRRGVALGDAVDECARRFRYESDAIVTIARALRADHARLTPSRLFAACRAEIPLDMGQLAQAVTPRFRDEELILPPAQRAQFNEVAGAMRALTEVHYGWGTARAWNESGVAVLFAGPPGTGKTMAAEVLAASLEMPMYRIDLSQVVNKYIGETEKNLKRLFDAADSADAILFFDECDALFGRRTEVRDAHDRYANVEISYLLERMERFKGLGILATNRRKDIDEAFLRRLRYIVEFPMPDARERRILWTTMIPSAVDASDVDLDFLARQFPLAGGHIRSIIFNACLQSADGHSHKQPRLTMENVVVAVRREYDKLGRSVTLEQFGPHASMVEHLSNA